MLNHNSWKQELLFLKTETLTDICFCKYFYYTFGTIKKWKKLPICISLDFDTFFTVKICQNVSVTDEALQNKMAYISDRDQLGISIPFE